LGWCYGPDTEANLKLCFISDTHGHYPENMPDADVLVHCGDFSSAGTYAELLNFGEWLRKIRHQYKRILVIPGNHDRRVQSYPRLAKERLRGIARLLINESYTYEGVTFYGSPYTPTFGHRWAYQLMDREQAMENWAKIPTDTSVLITHGPPQGILDKTVRGPRAGCPFLLARVTEIQPDIHAFGHIHEGYGQQFLQGTQFINASYMDENYRPGNAPIVVEL
jgi:Icc-related predicted phosphoesterase